MHPAGTHTYDFQIELPASLPSTFEGGYGYVRYFCKATIDKPWKFDHDVKVPFTVLSILDLNLQPIEFRVRQGNICSILSHTFSANIQMH